MKLPPSLPLVTIIMSSYPLGLSILDNTYIPFFQDIFYHYWAGYTSKVENSEIQSDLVVKLIESKEFIAPWLHDLLAV